MSVELRGEGVPERRGGGSGIWSRDQKCPLGTVRILHWRLSDGPYTEIYLSGIESWAFPRIYLQGHVECKTRDLFDMYVAEFFKLGTPQLLVSLLDSVSRLARKDGEQKAQMRMRVALGLEGIDQ